MGRDDFTKNRERWQQGDLFNHFREMRLPHQVVTPVLSDEHFSVDGTLIQAWAGHKRFKRKSDTDGDGANFHGTTRKNNTHQRTTDPDSRLYRKSEGKESKLCYMGHATRENRNGLAVLLLAERARSEGARSTRAIEDRPARPVKG